MKIASGLVFNKYDGKLIGFTNLGDADMNEAGLDNEKTLATHALLFFLLVSHQIWNFHMPTFATKILTATKITPLFWRCVAILERNCNLWVIATVCDGASANRKFFKLHSRMDGNSCQDVVYRTINLFCGKRYIYFFNDPPHLLKTVRNCLLNSGSGQCFTAYVERWQAY